MSPVCTETGPIRPSFETIDWLLAMVLSKITRIIKDLKFHFKANKPFFIQLLHKNYAEENVSSNGELNVKSLFFILREHLGHHTLIRLLCAETVAIVMLTSITVIND